MARIPLGSAPSDIAGGQQGVWVLSDSVGTLQSIDVTSNRAGLPIRIGESPTAIAVGLGAVWVSDQDGYVRRIDPFTERISEFRIGTPLQWIAVDQRDRDVWVAVGTFRS